MTYLLLPLSETEEHEMLTFHVGNPCPCINTRECYAATAGQWALPGNERTFFDLPDESYFSADQYFVQLFKYVDGVRMLGLCESYANVARRLSDDGLTRLRQHYNERSLNQENAHFYLALIMNAQFKPDHYAPAFNVLKTLLGRASSAQLSFSRTHEYSRQLHHIITAVWQTISLAPSECFTQALEAEIIQPLKALNEKQLFEEIIQNVVKDGRADDLHSLSIILKKTFQNDYVNSLLKMPMDWVKTLLLDQDLTWLDRKMYQHYHLKIAALLFQSNHVSIKRLKIAHSLLNISRHNKNDTFVSAAQLFRILNALREIALPMGFILNNLLPRLTDCEPSMLTNYLKNIANFSESIQDAKLPKEAIQYCLERTDADRINMVHNLMTILKNLHHLGFLKYVKNIHELSNEQYMKVCHLFSGDMSTLNLTDTDFLYLLRSQHLEILSHCCDALRRIGALTKDNFFEIQSELEPGLNLFCRDQILDLIDFLYSNEKNALILLKRYRGSLRNIFLLLVDLGENKPDAVQDVQCKVYLECYLIIAHIYFPQEIFWEILQNMIGLLNRVNWLEMCGTSVTSTLRAICTTSHPSNITQNLIWFLSRLADSQQRELRIIQRLLCDCPSDMPATLRTLPALHGGNLLEKTLRTIQAEILTNPRALRFFNHACRQNKEQIWLLLIALEQIKAFDDETIHVIEAFPLDILLQRNSEMLLTILQQNLNQYRTLNQPALRELLTTFLQAKEGKEEGEEGPEQTNGVPSEEGPAQINGVQGVHHTPRIEIDSAQETTLERELPEECQREIEATVVRSAESGALSATESRSEKGKSPLTTPSSISMFAYADTTKRKIEEPAKRTSERASAAEDTNGNSVSHLSPEKRRRNNQ